MSRRSERVASLIRSIVAEALQRHVSDPRLETLTSITRVEVSADLSVAKLYVSVMDENEARRKLAIEALRSASGRLRRLVGEQVTLRQVPELIFRLDDSVRKGMETVRIIDETMREYDAAETSDSADAPPNDNPPEEIADR